MRTTPRPLLRGPRIPTGLGAEVIDVDSYLGALTQAAGARGYPVEVLGKVEGLPLLYLPGPSTGRRVLVAGGFHGDEPAGPLAILAWLLSGLEVPGVSVSFLPLANPTGFRDNTRYTVHGEQLNQGWIWPGPGETLSWEGQQLLHHVGRLVLAARDGFLTLHEDWEPAGYYFYACDDVDGPTGPLVARFRQVGDRWFRPFDGIYRREGVRVRNGLVWEGGTGSFEDLLHEVGIPRVITSETPSGEDLWRRAACQFEWIRAFLG